MMTRLTNHKDWGPESAHIDSTSEKPLGPPSQRRGRLLSLIIHRVSLSILPKMPRLLSAYLSPSSLGLSRPV